MQRRPKKKREKCVKKFSEFVATESCGTVSGFKLLGLLRRPVKRLLYCTTSRAERHQSMLDMNWSVCLIIYIINNLLSYLMLFNLKQVKCLSNAILFLFDQEFLFYRYSFRLSYENLQSFLSKNYYQGFFQNLFQEMLEISRKNEGVTHMNCSIICLQ